MAKISSAIGRKRRGRVGGESYRSTSGVTIVQEKSGGTSLPASDLQTGNRSAFSMLASVARIVKPALNVGFAELKKPSKRGKLKKSVEAAFLGSNRKKSQNVFDYSMPDMPMFQPGNMIVSKGSIAITRMTTATGYASSQDIIITWPTLMYSSSQQINDIPWGVAYNATTNIWRVANTLAKRGQGLAYLAFYNLFFPFAIDDEVHLWIFFQGVDTSTGLITGKVSGSVYTSLTIQG